MGPQKKSKLCPNCNGKAKFVSNVLKEEKRRLSIILGRYKCSECGWRSELQEPDQPTTRRKNPVYLKSHFFKEGKMLYIAVYTTERVVDPDVAIADLDRHLLTIEVTPTSLRICPNVPFSLQNKRVEEGLMFLQDNKDLVASLCAECSPEQKKYCLHNKEPCKKIDKDIKP